MYFGVRNDAGQRLLDEHVAPACARRGFHLQVAPEGADRGTALAAQAVRTLLAWDGSVEGPQDVYRAMTMWTKLSPKHLLMSRTPLPRNVLTRHQCAPVHGAAFGNDVLGEWFDRQLARVAGEQGGEQGGPVAGASLPYWMFDDPADFFLSFRGTRQAEAEAWRAEFVARTGRPVRMVPPNEFAYPTEVVTQQQQWEGAARLMHEIRATGRVIFFPSPDYFTSFWTSTEALAVRWLTAAGRRPRRGERRLSEVRLLTDPAPEPLLGTRALTDAETARFAALINNGDPITSAPETMVAPRGPARLLRAFVRRYGYYREEFTTDAFWHLVRVPCPACRPRRTAAEVDWSAHMALPGPQPQTDAYGYFPAHAGELARGTIRCPSCSGELRLVNRRGVRTLWQPVMTTEADQDRPVIVSHPVWEVLT